MQFNSGRTVPDAKPKASKIGQPNETAVHGSNGHEDDGLFYGILGQITKFIRPQSEADPAAIYLQLVVGVGNFIGRKAYFEIEATKHYTNLFANIVGDSSVSRKGTSVGYTKRLFEEIDPLYLTQFVEGLSSGEGLIAHVRDCPAIIDKRCLIMESEFARVLKVMSRANNILSTVLRAAWDGSNLYVLTRNESLRATNPHISIIGHITEEEMRKEMGECDVFNGFANRFLWLSVKRSKLLPQGGNIDWPRFKQYAERLSQICDQAGQIERMSRDEEATEHWKAVYPELTSGRQGLLGAATNRADAQVVRLSMIFALTDGSAIIQLRHVQAALALWNRCFQSALKLFGPKIQSKYAQKIFDELKKRPNGTMTRTEITVDIFGRNIRAELIGAALFELSELQLAGSAIHKQTNGRPAEVWFLRNHS